MVTAEQLETWVHNGHFDRPHTGEDPPFQTLHLPAGKVERQLADRPHDVKDSEDDVEADSSSDTDDDFDSSSYVSDDMPYSQDSTKTKGSYKSAGDKDYRAYITQLDGNGVSAFKLVPTEALGLNNFELEVRRITSSQCLWFAEPFSHARYLCLEIS